MSNADSQQNVDAIRKILFGHEQQQLEQKIEALTTQLSQLSSKQNAQGQDHQALVGTMNQARLALASSIETQVGLVQKGIAEQHQQILVKVSQDSTSKLEGVQKSLQSLHADMDAKLASYATQTNNNVQRLSTALEQANARIKQLEDNERGLKQALAQAFGALSAQLK